MPLLKGKRPSVQVTVDCGFPHVKDFVTVTVTGLSWVRSDSIIVCTPVPYQSADRDFVDTIIEGIRAVASNNVPGLSFDLTVMGDHGVAGKYIINCLGD